MYRGVRFHPVMDSSGVMNGAACLLWTRTLLDTKSGNRTHIRFNIRTLSGLLHDCLLDFLLPVRPVDQSQKMLLAHLLMTDFSITFERGLRPITLLRDIINFISRDKPFK